MLEQERIGQMPGFFQYRQHRADRTAAIEFDCGDDSLADAMIEFFLGLQVWGTPEQCFDKIMHFRELTGGGAYNGVFSYAGMPYEEAEKSMRLFAREVMPLLKAVEAEPLGVGRSAA